MLTMNGCEDRGDKRTATEFISGLSHAADEILEDLKEYFHHPDQSQAVVDLPDIRITPEEKLDIILGKWRPKNLR
jgi:hypothetical protein